MAPIGLERHLVDTGHPVRVSQGIRPNEKGGKENNVTDLLDLAPDVAEEARRESTFSVFPLFTPQYAGWK
jgi:hypothetical protein